MAAYLLSMGSQWDHGSHLQALFRFSQSIQPPPEKRCSKVDASKPPPDGSVRVWKAEFSAGCKSLLVTQSKKQAAFEPIIHPGRAGLRNGVSDTALYTLKREGD